MLAYLTLATFTFIATYTLTTNVIVAYIAAQVAMVWLIAHRVRYA